MSINKEARRARGAAKQGHRSPMAFIRGSAVWVFWLLAVALVIWMILDLGLRLGR